MYEAPAQIRDQGDSERFGIADERLATLMTNERHSNENALNDDMKIALISERFREIMELLGLDLSTQSLNRTPDRVARMFVKEIFRGLNPESRPEIALFENDFQYGEMVVEVDIRFYSTCEHHFLPIIGKAHVAYIPNGEVIGLSKINRIVEYVARRPQVQERLTVDIANGLKDAAATEDVGVVLEAHHLCVAMRGVKDGNSSTTTTSFSGKFQNGVTRETFLKLVTFQEQSHAGIAGSPR